MEEKRTVEKNINKKCVGRNYLGNVVVEDRITFRWILYKIGCVSVEYFIWFWKRISSELFPTRQ
jgi:hypothetical protein